MHFHATLPIMHGLVEKMVEDFVTASPRLLKRQVSMDEVMYEVTGRMGFGERLSDTNFF